MRRERNVAAKRTTTLFVCLAVLTLGSAEAQTSNWDGRGFISISGGGQFSDGEFETQLSVPTFDETARFETNHTSGSGGLLDVAGGVRIAGNLGVGVGLSLLTNQNDVSGTGTAPNPLFFDRPRDVVFQETGLEHREVGIHLSAVYIIPVSDRFLVSVFGGPTLFRLRQDIVSSVELGPETAAPLFDMVDVASVSTTSISETGFGGHIGFDGTFLLNDQLGVGGFFRYAGGSVDLPTGDTVVPVDVGGVQVGGGLRLFF